MMPTEEPKSKSDTGRDAMQFPFRWYDTLLDLPEFELRAMLAAMRDYAEKKVVPNFTGALAALWREFQRRMDCDREKYLAICDRNRENGKKGAAFGKLGGRPKKNPEKPPKTPNGDLETPNGDKKTPKNPQKPPILQIEEKKETMLKHGKENASLFSLSGHEDEICQSSIQPGPNFKKWSAEQFKRSVEDAITERPEYAPYREKFIRYWTEPDSKGRPRFQLEKTWRTVSRLATWHERNTDTRRPDTRQDAAPFDVQAEIARMQERHG